jgi:guanine nucleotide-binding protein G(i) subunit alpha
MKIIHRGGYEDWERSLHKEAIFSSTIEYMRTILNAHPKLELTLLPENEAFRSTILALPLQYNSGTLNEKIADAIRGLWEDPAIDNVVQPRPKDWNAAVHYFDSIDRIAAPEYIPTDQDIMYRRTETHAIAETAYHVGELTYKVFDVSGVGPGYDRRKKWLQFFDNVTAVIFVASLSDYDEVVLEDGSSVRPTLPPVRNAS